MTPQIVEQNNQPLVSSLFQILQRDILTGNLHTGTKLTEQILCKKYKCSRTPVREALRQLEIDGLVENQPNRGCFVAGISQNEISDLFDMRTLYEVQAVEWATQRMNNEEIDALKETVELMEFYTLKDDIEKVLLFNGKFHSLIYSGTKDRMLEKMLFTYQTYLRYSAPAKIFHENYLKTILDEHRAIFNAVESRDVEAGKSAMAHHMKQTKLRRMAK